MVLTILGIAWIAAFLYMITAWADDKAGKWFVTLAVLAIPVMFGYGGANNCDVDWDGRSNTIVCD